MSNTSAPASSPPARDPALALLSVEPGGVLLTLWVTVFVLGNIYAAYWLVKAFLNAHPEKRHALRQALGKCWPARSAAAAAGSDGTSPDAMLNGFSRDGTKLPQGGHPLLLLLAPVSKPAAGLTAAASGAAEHVYPVLLEWRDLGTKVRSAMGSKMILQDVTGAVAPGELQALVGPSGAGKSSLMDRLAMRDSSGKAGGGGASVRTGHVLVNGQPRTQGFLKMSAYVPQHDNLVPTMTCEESLHFYAAVILPPATSRAEKQARIADVLRLVGLQDKAQALVGGVLAGGLLLRGLSGGEKKRLAIAAGVVAKPSLVFLDEPTSGLDSQSALQVLEVMKTAVVSGHTIIASVHQPRSAIWNLFDSVTLLSKGRLMYHGPTANMVSWFSVLGYFYDPTVHGSASDWVLDLVSLGFDKRVEAGGGGGSVAATSAAASSSQSSIAEEGDDLALEQVQDMVARKVTASALAHTMGGLAELGRAADAFTYAQKALQPQWFGRGLLMGGAGAASCQSLASLGVGGAAGGSSSGGGGSSSSGKWLGCIPVPAGRRGGGLAAGDTGAGQAAAEDASSAAVAAQFEEATQAFAAAGGRLQVPAAAAMSRRIYDQQQQMGGGAAAAAAGQKGSATAAVVIDGPMGTKGSLGLLPSSSDESSPTAASSPKDGLSLAPGQQQALLLPQQQRGGLMASLRQFWVHFKALMWRDYLMTTRNPADVAGRMLTFTYVGLISGIIMYGLPADASSVWKRMQVCYALLSFYMLLPFVFMSLFWSDKRFYTADAASKIYHPRAYYPAKFVAGLPFNVAVALSFHLVYYAMAGLRHAPWAVAQSAAIAVLMCLIGMQVVYCCAVVAGSQDLAFVYAIAWTALNLLINPYMQAYQNFQQQWLTALQYVSASSFAWQGMVHTELGNRGFNCSAGGGLDAFGIFSESIPRNGSLGLISGRMNDLGPDCVANGNVVLQYYGASRGFGATIGILVGYLAVVHAVTYFALWRASAKLAVKK